MITSLRQYCYKAVIYAILLWGGASLDIYAKSIHTWAEHSVLAEGDWVKIKLNQDQDGIYQITYSQLRSWGFSDPTQVGVYGFGGHTLPESLAENHIDDLPEVAVLHDKAKQRILFYGRGIISWSYKDATTRYVQRQHPYSTYSTYFLHQKNGEAPRSIIGQASGEGIPADTLTEYDEYWLHETESTNLGKSGRMWVGESFLNIRSQTFNLPEETALKGHVLKPGSALLTVSFVTKSNTSTSFKVRVGNRSFDNQTVAATTSSYGFGTEAIWSRSMDTLALGNTQIDITYNPGNASPSAARLNYIRLQGRCPLEASPNEAYLLFRNAKAIRSLSAYRISSLTSQMQVWDVTSPTDILQQELIGNSSFVAPEIGLREYAIINLGSNAFPGVTRLGTVRNQDLHSIQPVNLVILTPYAFMAEAETLAEYRLQHDQLSSLVLTPEAIYNEYSSGVPDASAIRLFLKQMYDREVDENGDHTLRYFLLFGDGSYNNRSAASSKNYLLTYESESSMVETSSFVSDDFFGFLDDNEGGKTDGNGNYTLSNDRLDIGIGRLTVSNTEQAANIVDKIIRYDDDQYGSWKNRLCFLSDDDKIETSATDAPNVHMKHNDQLVKMLQDAGHHEFLFQKIYLPAYQRTASASGTDYPDARKDLNNALQQGVLILNYAGHGAANNITHEQIMSANLASQLRMKHLPVWITASCDVSRWDGDENSMGENLLLNPKGGAAALISTTRVVYASQNLSLNKAIINHLFDRNKDGSRFRLGDIIRASKVALGSDYNKLNFCLLGDPTMTLAFPEQEIVIDSVHGEFKSLSTVRIQGHVNKTGSKEVDTDFHGLIYPTIYDAEDSIKADKGLWNTEYDAHIFAARSRKVFSGRDLILAGRFEFSFVVPQDISQREGTGLINLYACSENGNEANGYFKDFSLVHSDSISEADTIGPRIIACFMDDPMFQSGDVVSATPYFYAEVQDESGINATGNSIGHDICLNLQCISNPLVATRQVILNDYFTTFTGSFKYGNVRYSLTDLAPGTYQATFRIWDVHNNVTTYSFTFTSSRDTRPKIALLNAYPSPVHQGESVTFRALHNRPESADSFRLQIYTQTGVKVWDQTVSSSSGEVVYLEPGAESLTQISHALNADETSQLMGCTTITWTANVAPGVYLYRAYLTAGGEETVTQSKLLMVQ